MPDMQKAIAYVILGSNEGDPIAHINTALKQINSLPNTEILKKSSFYQSPFLGDENQKDVINLAIQIKTLLKPQELLDNLLAIEQLHGRIRSHGKHIGRTLDCDILLYEDQIINTKDLIIPHPRLTQRDFVLIPLLEIAPHIILPPSNDNLSDYLKNIPHVTVEKLD